MANGRRHSANAAPGKSHPGAGACRRKIIDSWGADIFIVPHGLRVGDHNNIWVTGEVGSRFRRSGNYDGPTGWFHDIAVDRDGNLYVGDILHNRILKFRKIEAE